MSNSVSLPLQISEEPDGVPVVLHLTGTEVDIKNWISYSYNEHFLTPSDSFTFVIGSDVADHLDDEVLGLLVPGALVSLSFGGNVQASGYIDGIDKHASRGSGIEWTISGRDKLGQAVDSGIDPTTQFKPTQSLEDLLVAVYAPFGWDSPDKFVIDNADNRGVITGQKRGTPTSKKGKPLKSFEIHQLRPYPREGAHEFASRVCQRQGLWIWPSADGKVLIVSTPNFDQEPLYTIRRTFDGTNNVLEGQASFNTSDQPSVIVADGFGGGGEFGHSRLRAVLVNPCVALDPDAPDGGLEASSEYQAIISKYAPLLLPKNPPAYAPAQVPTLRVMYLHDDESKTPDELANFVYREMALRIRKSLTVRYTVEGHGQFDSYQGQFVPWAVDTVVDVQDQVAGINEPMWILSRTFHRSRSGGTTTDIELIRLHSMEF